MLHYMIIEITSVFNTWQSRHKRMQSFLVSSSQMKHIGNFDITVNIVF